ncbi:MAG: NADH-quinone oxidoreductase subunit J [Deltaproteobacteria bacterium]|nr:NADH-quinone oxidoreductase subunit J [Deltaproteobacteria bacterium]
MEFIQIVFWLLAAGAILTSLMVVLPRGRNPLYGALALILSFFFVAGIYVLLVAHTMAILQILVYAGAIMVLFTFVIMLLNLSKRELGEESKNLAQALGVGAVAFIIIKSIIIVDASADSVGGDNLALPKGFGTIESIADQMFHRHLLSFELIAILLLVAVIGAVVLAKRTL